jgi:preprotein translocase subunit YajC
MTSLSVHDTRKIFLANEYVRGVLAIYNADVPEGQPQPKKTFYKTFDAGIEKGDFVIVPSGTRHSMTVVKVTDVDVEIDLANQTPVTWIIGKIDRRAHEKTLAQESEMLNVIRAAEKKKMTDELKATVFGTVDQNTIAKLAIAQRANTDPSIAVGQIAADEAAKPAKS